MMTFQTSYQPVHLSWEDTEYHSHHGGYGIGEYAWQREDGHKMHDLTSIGCQAAFEYESPAFGHGFSIDQSILDSMHTTVVNGSILRLNNSGCMAKYANNLIIGSRTLLLITTDTDLLVSIVIMLVYLQLAVAVQLSAPHAILQAMMYRPPYFR
ncbi:hypothetical protein BDZ45DRAFT_800057 [Acephala macrosclerotiorum]|nr:hypothetical protein BDZ45DRAFT_800057 [Acephala macrosclerotiorum]